MKEHCIDLNQLILHGKAQMKFVEKSLEVYTTHAITPIALNLSGESYKRHYVALPEKYKLPLRIDMRIKLDYPALFLFIGSGHVLFGLPDHNRKIEDLMQISKKLNHDYDFFKNRIPLGEFINISITYNLDEMQILIGGEERFYGQKQPYMKAKNLCEINKEGLSIGLAVSKRSTLSIDKITVTEFETQAPITRGNFEKIKVQTALEHPKATFDTVLSQLPKEYQGKMMEMDSFLTSLRPMKFKRVIDKNGGKITYIASDYGVSYGFNISAGQLTHNFGWYIVTSGKPETWHRKADFMEETLAEIKTIDHPLATRIFYALNDCVGCYGARCLAKTGYAFDGQKRLSCHGRVLLRMCEEDFHDARDFFGHFNVLMAQKIADGYPWPEKLFLIKDGHSVE